MSSGIHQRYKRSQIEQVIQAIDGAREVPKAVLRANVKRLLDFDRNPEARILQRASDTLAFFDGPSKGQGTEVAYRPYQAFALLIGLRLLKAGMPQSRVVLFLRDVRVELEPAFARLASEDPAKLRPGLSEEQRLELIQGGELVGKASEMTFLIAQASADPSGAPRPDEWGTVGQSVGDHNFLLDHLADLSKSGQVAIVLELTNVIHQLMDALPRTTVRKRGRQ